MKSKEQVIKELQRETKVYIENPKGYLLLKTNSKRFNKDLRVSISINTYGSPKRNQFQKTIQGDWQYWLDFDNWEQAQKKIAKIIQGYETELKRKRVKVG